MSHHTQAGVASSGARLRPVAADPSRTRAGRRATHIVAAITLGAAGLLVDLLLVGHTRGGEVWGLVTAAGATLTGLLSLAYLTMRSRSRTARVLLYALWATVAFFGVGGYNDHRAPVTPQSVDQRQRPPLAPLIFTGLGVAGAMALRSGSKGK